MQSVTVAKPKLVEILTTNRAKHLAEYNKAVTEFRQAARKILQDALDSVVADDAPIDLKDKLKDMYVRLPAPSQFLKEYDKALKMLELSTKDEIELTEDEFSSYIDDDWAWKATFSASNRAYGSKMMAALAYDEGPIG
jgi:hypothetical protein